MLRYETIGIHGRSSDGDRESFYFPGDWPTLRRQIEDGEKKAEPVFKIWYCGPFCESQGTPLSVSTTGIRK
jgi:hypothetical protein